MWIDDRDGTLKLAVTDRSNGRLQWFNLEGKHLKTMNNPFTLPVNIDIHRELMLVPDLASRITLLDKNEKAIHLSHDPEWDQHMKASKRELRQ